MGEGTEDISMSRNILGSDSSSTISARGAAYYHLILNKIEAVRKAHPDIYR